MEAKVKNMENAADNKKLPRVLVVDDDAEIRRAIWFILRSEFDVTAVENGHKALEQLRKGKRFDVASLVLRMPGMSGTDTLQEIRKIDPTMEVLIMTAHSDLESAKKALKLGAFDYIDKPFNKETYREAIRNGVKRRDKSEVSDDVKEQLEFVKAQLKVSEKFAVIGQLIAGVVHELNNSLNSVIGFSGLLTEENLPSNQKEEYLKNIAEAAKLSQSIVQKLLAFFRNQESDRAPVQVNDILYSSLDLKEHDFYKHEIVLIRKLKANLPVTEANFNELQQVFLNIINNAQHAVIEQNGPRMITISSDFDDKVIRVSIEDTGIGIPQKHLQKIFEPLYTTKEKGVGTGLGLSVCYDIIRDHNGTIFVASEIGKGTCFVIELPIMGETDED